MPVNEFSVTSTVGKTQSQPANTIEQHAARQNLQRLFRPVTPHSGHAAVSVYANSLYAGGTQPMLPQFQRGSRDPQGAQNGAPAGRQRHQDDEDDADAKRQRTTGYQRPAVPVTRTEFAGKPVG
jgi:hypothetical protein